jgi:hypothetical protein
MSYQAAEKIWQNLATNSANFCEIREKKSPYVDKTSYLVELLSSATDTWFFARPRRFGKSLTVSTLETVFSGRKELFKGLAIEEALDDERFAPRPVISLDMSRVTTTCGAQGLKESLGRLTARSARLLGLEAPENLPPGELLSTVIKECALKFDRRPAILVDEYDTPLLSFLTSNREELPGAASEISEFYSGLKASRRLISFVFVTGITQLWFINHYSAFNNYTNISYNVDYGAMAGFTHEEITQYFADYIVDAAKSLNIRKKSLLEHLKSYYYGFCFDGQTLLYNPFSMLQFFFHKNFNNYWFNTGPSDVLARFLKNSFYTIEDFRGIPISGSYTADERSASINIEEPRSFLYQAGYLSLRPGPTRDNLRLDFPNREVLECMSRQILVRVFGSDAAVEDSARRFRDCLARRDPAGVVSELNRLISKVPYDDFGGVEWGYLVRVGQPEEFLYRSCLRTYLFGVGVDFPAEEPLRSSRASRYGRSGRSGLVVKHQGQVWALELKICRDGESDQKAAKDALKQIVKKGQADGYENPVRLGIAIDNEERVIKAWESRGEDFN